MSATGERLQQPTTASDGPEAQRPWVAEGMGWSTQHGDTSASRANDHTLELLRALVKVLGDAVRSDPDHYAKLPGRHHR